MRILIVDDEPLVRWFFKRALGKWSHSVKVAESVAEARDIIAEQPFDLVVIDLHFPTGNGIDLVRYLITHNYGPEQLVACSATFSLEIQQELAQKKVRMLMKPFTMKELRRVIEVVEPDEENDPVFVDPFYSWRPTAQSC